MHSKLKSLRFLRSFQGDSFRLLFLVFLVCLQGCFVVENTSIESNQKASFEKSDMIQSSGVLSLTATRRVYLSEISKMSPELTKLVIRSGANDFVVLSGKEARELSYISIKEPPGDDQIIVSGYKNGTILFTRKVR